MNKNIDNQIGIKIKIKRTSLGITQEELGKKIGISFQQVQKYEKGETKITCGKLYEIANILNIPVGDFFSNDNSDFMLNDNKFKYLLNNNDKNEIKKVPNKEILTLVKYFNKIEDKNIKTSILNLVKSFATLK